MGKFCTKCGRPLQEGEICSCQMPVGNQQAKLAGQQVMGQQNNVQVGQQFNSQAAQQTMGRQFSSQAGQQAMGQQFSGQAGQQAMGQQFSGQAGQQFSGQAGQQAMGQQFSGQAGQQTMGQQFGNQASAFAQNFLGRVLSLVKKPVTAGKELIVEADIKVALLLIAFQGIFSGIFALAVSSKFSQYIKAASGLMDGISSGLGNVMTEALTMPYFRIFVVTLIFSVVLAVVIAGMLTLGHLIMKIPVSFQQMLSATAIRSAVLVPAILLSIIIFELSMTAGLALFILINIWGFAAMIVAMSSFVGKEKLNIFVLVVSIIILLFIVITALVFSKIWTLYLPDMMRTAMNGIKSISVQDILEKFMGSSY